MPQLVAILRLLMPTELKPKDFFYLSHGQPFHWHTDFLSLLKRFTLPWLVRVVLLIPFRGGNVHRNRWQPWSGIRSKAWSTKVSETVEAQIVELRESTESPMGMLKIAQTLEIGTGTVQRVIKEMQ